jgi:predicted permease
MHRRPDVLPWFRLRPDTPERVAEQVDEEIELHIELRTRQLMVRGWTEKEARVEAERRFGSVERARLKLQRAARERERRMTLREWLSGWAQDFRYSARALAREWPLAGVIVLTLALGIGANAVMFGIVDQLLLRGPAYVEDASQVRRLYITQQQWDGTRTTQVVGYIAYTQLRDHADSFDGVAAYRSSMTRLGRGESARELTAGWATADLFALLGVQPRLGRFFTAEEDAPGEARKVAVIDHGFWQAEYGGATDVLGRTLELDDGVYTIIGVAPRGFTGPELKTISVWLPFSTGYEPHPEWQTTFNARWLQVVARLRQGISPEVAAAEATRLYRSAAEGSNRPEATASLLPLRYGPAGEDVKEAAVSRWLLGVAMVVLLVAAANVMNLLVARVLRRRREVSVRLALGIPRSRLVRLLLSESLLLGLAGLGAALAFTWFAGPLIRSTLLPDVQWQAALDARILLVATSMALLTGLLVGIAPALQSTRQDVVSGLRGGARDGGQRRVARDVLTALQVAFSVVLLIGAGLFVRSLWNVLNVQLGLDADRVLAVWVQLPPPAPGAAPHERSRGAFYQQAVEHLRAHPGVENAAAALGTPLQNDFGVSLAVPGWDSIPAMPGGGPYVTAGMPGYFETVGTRILRGRGFVEGEGAGSEAVAVVNERMAATLWPGEDPLTKCIIIGSGSDVPCARVIGIAENVHRSGIRQEPIFQYYIPLGQERGISGTQIVVRPRANATAFIPELRRQLHSLRPDIVHLSISPLQQRLDPQIRPWRMGATMFLVFGTLALLIAAVGLYSVIGYNVAQRRLEIGVRMALGASRRSITAMIVRQGLVVVLAGALVGAIVAYALAHLIEPLLFDTQARDAGTFGAVTAILIGVGLLASAVPAARAGRMNLGMIVRE